MTLLSSALALLWFAVFWLLTRDRRQGVGLMIWGAWACITAIALAAAVIWPAIAAGYPQDSFWTLDTFGRIGVAAISGIGISLIFLALAMKSRIILRFRRGPTATAWALIDIAIGLLAYGVIFSLSPQIFYSFYRMIFANLPQQWVIDGVLDQDRLKMIAVMAPGGSLADHLAGVTLWAILPFTAWLHMRCWWRGG